MIVNARFFKANIFNSVDTSFGMSIVIFGIDFSSLIIIIIIIIIIIAEIVVKVNMKITIIKD